MTGLQALAVLDEAQALLRQQAALLAATPVELVQAEELGQRVGALLADLPPAERLDGLDDDLRGRLRDAAQRTAAELSMGVAALAQHRDDLQADQARAERGGAALRHYLPDARQAPRYFDERR